ncbi:MAG: urea ABC transporter permease subunit UrtB [Gammaproteobacteria bacterium]|nr:urea ABC transporter permease subunit UrtB [Gammaproteobacteria bacterium]
MSVIKSGCLSTLRVCGGCRLTACLFLLCALPLFSSGVLADDNELIQTLVPELTHKSKEIRIEALNTLAQSDASRKSLWLQSILDGEMYVLKSTGDAVIAEKSGKEYVLTSAVDGSDLGVEKKRAIRKFRVDNAIRTHLRSLIGSLALENPDPEQRLDAVNALMGKADESTVERIRALKQTETDPSVAEAFTLLIAVHDLDSDNPERQTAALKVVDGNLDNNAINALRKLSTDSDNPEMAVRAKALLTKAEAMKVWYTRAETVFFGLSLGSVLVIAAIGLAITFGVMGVINMAHGELIMLGAYTTYFVQLMMPNWIDYSLLVAVPAAFIVSGLVGILIERTVIQHLYGRPLETLLATFGISLILQQVVRTFVSSQNVAVINPSWMSGSWMVNPALSLTLNRMVIIAFCLCVFAVLLFVFTRTGFGLQMRAVAQNRDMARAMGIRSARVDALTFGLGSGIAGMAGVALSQLGNVGPNLGQNYIIDSFMVVVFGGVGNLWGTLVAGMSLGIGNKLLEPWAGAVLAKIVLLVFIILFIQKRPRGLFPQRGRSVDA